VSDPHCERENKAVNPPVTLEMIRRGLDKFFGWDPETDEPAAMVIAVYCAMAKVAKET
jgi:hypothetical protein